MQKNAGVKGGAAEGVLSDVEWGESPDGRRRADQGTERFGGGRTFSALVNLGILGSAIRPMPSAPRLSAHTVVRFQARVQG